MSLPSAHSDTPRVPPISTLSFNAEIGWRALTVRYRHILFHTKDPM